MSTIVSLPDQATAKLPRRSYLNQEYGLWSWLLTGDHKRIAILYLISITVFFVLGGILAGLVRLELLTPVSDLMSTDTYNKTFSQHGIIMRNNPPSCSAATTSAASSRSASMRGAASAISDAKARARAT